MIGGPPTKGFGFAFGLDRMVMSLPEAESERLRASDAPDVFIVFLGDAARQHSFTLAQQLRRAGLSVVLDFDERKMKKAMAQANKLAARYALIVGDNEIAQGAYGLKNLTTGEQASLNLEAIVEQVKSR